MQHKWVNTGDGRPRLKLTSQTDEDVVILGWLIPHVDPHEVSISGNYDSFIILPPLEKTNGKPSQS